MSKPKTKKYNFSIEVPVYKETRRGGVTMIPMTIHVEGAMAIITRAIGVKHQDLLDEYAKLWVLKRVGVKTYPVKL